MKTYLFLSSFVLSFVPFIVSADVFPPDAVSVSFNLTPSASANWPGDFGGTCFATGEDTQVALFPCPTPPGAKTILYVKAKRETPIPESEEDSYILVSCADNAGYHNYIEIDRVSDPESEWWGSDTECDTDIFLQNTDSQSQARVWITYVPRVLATTTYIGYASSSPLYFQDSGNLTFVMLIIVVFIFVAFAGYVFNHLFSKHSW